MTIEEQRPWAEGEWGRAIAEQRALIIDISRKITGTTAALDATHSALDALHEELERLHRRLADAVEMLSKIERDAL